MDARRITRSVTKAAKRLAAIRIPTPPSFNFAERIQAAMASASLAQQSPEVGMAGTTPSPAAGEAAVQVGEGSTVQQSVPPSVSHIRPQGAPGCLNIPVSTHFARAHSRRLSHASGMIKGNRANGQETAQAGTRRHAQAGSQTAGQGKDGGGRHEKAPRRTKGGQRGRNEHT
ncbi:hypothetical protein DENSPDRAFT_854964 [Dentipellis sp. KUC8613]|nr:hypothetical protein DENSPDRAFT_854964 [Dentipellis sp. KUC8613]